MTHFTPKELLNYLLEGNILTPDKLERFIQEYPDETQDFEYKNGMITTRAKRPAGRKTIREYISGFANSDGGVLIVGVNEDTPRAVAPCEPSIGGQPLCAWAQGCLHDMGGYFSPLPRCHIIDHPRGPVLAIAVARAPLLVPCYEASELKYFFRVGDSTRQIPEYLIADLVLGRRQHPILDLHLLPIEESRSAEAIREIPVRAASFRFDIENVSLPMADEVTVGVISWSLGQGAREEIGNYLRSYIEITKLPFDAGDSSLIHETHRSSIASGKMLRVGPFQRGQVRGIGPFYFPSSMSLKIACAVYIISRNAPPTWFQLEFESLRPGIPLATGTSQFKPHVIRKGSERPKIAWETTSFG